MTTNGLTPVKLVDKNGHAVTRWVKVLDSGEPVINLPAPQVQVQSPLAATVFSELFPDFNEETIMPITVFGDDSFTSYEFSEHAIQLLPPATLKGLSEKLDSRDTSGAQCYMVRAVYEYVENMLAHATEDRVSEDYDRSVREVNNAITFHDAFTGVYEKVGYHASAGQASGVMRRALGFFEDRGADTPNHREDATEVDYSKADEGVKARARGAVMAYVLSGRFNGGNDRELADLMGDYPEDQQRIAELVEQRETTDVGLLRELLAHDTPAVSDGVL